jgi:organic hydroperoxide reductase OsmC/OhrA
MIDSLIYAHYTLLYPLRHTGKSFIAETLARTSPAEARALLAHLHIPADAKDAKNSPRAGLDVAVGSEAETEADAPLPIYSADSELALPDGAYGWHPSLLPAAHSRCYASAVQSMAAGAPLVIVDNTHTVTAEVKPYLEAAVAMGYAVATVEPSTPWAKDVEALADRNSHGVSFFFVSDSVISSLTLLLLTWLCRRYPHRSP